MRRTILILVLLAACTTTSPVVVERTSRFELRSHFWVNLHHYLFSQARFAPAERPAFPGTEEEQARWNAALDHYRATYREKRRELVSDGELIEIKEMLRAADEDALPSGLPAALRKALEDAAPVYRRLYWPQHDASNRRWIAEVAPKLARSEDAVLRELHRLLRMPDPGRVTVDVSYVSNWLSAYTTIQPTHATIASSDQRYRGYNAFEVVIHETSHGLIDATIVALREEAKRQGVRIPGDLWHVILFYTEGEVVRNHLRTIGVEHEPFGFSLGVYERGWQTELELVRTHWHPYLEGKVTFEEAIRAVVAAAGKDEG